MSARIWWRDDDAGRAHPNLDPLLDLASALERPMALAVVPTWLEPSVVDRILACPWASVLQHGVAHADHGHPGDRNIELGGTVDRAALDDALQAGRTRLEDAFGDRFLPVMVPPWNRIADDVVARLPALGFRGLSCWGEPSAHDPLHRHDVHVDAVAWREGNRPRSAAELRRALREAIDEALGDAVGFMTHHMVLGSGDWHDLDRVLRFGHDDDEVLWTSAEELFGEP